MRTSKVISRSVVLPVNLYAVKEHLGIFHDEKNNNLNILMNAATNIAEKFTGQIFRVGGDVFEQVCEKFGDSVELDYGPATGITYIKYFDSSDTEQTLTTGQYQFLDWLSPQRVAFDDFMPTLSTSRNDPVRIRYVAGYAKAADVPSDVKSAILLLTQHLYDNPGDSVKKLPTTSEYILRNYKVH